MGGDTVLNLNSFLLFSEQPEVLVAFYSKVFEKDPQWSKGGYSGWKVGDGMFVIGPHDKVKGGNTHPERMMFNLETEDVQKEYDRIKATGATVIQELYHPGEEPSMQISTFADPDGNYFQVTTPAQMPE